MRDDDARYYRKPWMSDGQWECSRLLADLFGGFHHLSGPIKAFGDGVAVDQLTAGFATFDFDELTRMVFLAHDRCIRVHVGQSGRGMLKVVALKRKGREGGMAQRHPTIEQALETYRRKWPAPVESPAGEPGQIAGGTL